MLAVINSIELEESIKFINENIYLTHGFFALLSV